MADPQVAKEAGHHPTEPEWEQRLRTAAIEAEYETGRREENERDARRNVLKRIGVIVLGSLVTLAGLLMMVLPGPGILTLIAGFSILAQEVPWADRMLDKLKKKARVEEMKTKPLWVRLLIGAGTVLAVAFSVWFSFFR